MPKLTVQTCGLLALVSLGFFPLSQQLAWAKPSASETNNTPYVPSPLPPPVQPPNVVALTKGEQLGKDIFFDHTLSEPEGYSCATCHVPQTGFTGPSSLVNLLAGPMPGVIPGRAGRRKPQAIPYSSYSPEGPFFIGIQEGGTYFGGTFWDGRAPDTIAQARMPFLDQNEMANTPIGPYPPHAGGYSPLVAQKLSKRPYTELFKEVFGHDIFVTSSAEQIYALMTAAISLYEASAEINQFSSKYDASTNGTPARHLYRFTSSEENGRKLFFGDAQCFQCHSSAGFDPVEQVTQGKETFTMFCYANIGVPSNPGNPYYNQTNCEFDPECNPLGSNYIDLGMAANPNPAPDGTVFLNDTPGDLPQFKGLFKAPSLRNVDKRPYPSFVKSYMHNGVFKSLEDVVHFYNKRNIATNAAGDEVSFPLYAGAPEGYTAIFPPSEIVENTQNLFGYTPAEAEGTVLVDFDGQIGNLELTDQEETDLVNFLKTLTDGYMSPQPVPVDLTYSLIPPASAPQSGAFVMQLSGALGHSYLVQTSTNLRQWVTVSTNVLTSPTINITNVVIPGAQQFWRSLVAR